ncbi:unnamed protein product [Trichobilharzia regenti]|nr:unnamed protein product [Trichobilharzia regenti]
MNHSAEQKESRIQLRKLHTESGEYELGSLVGESEENLHCTGINGTHSSNDTKTDSSELTIIEDRREDMDNLIVAHTDINSMKMTEKSFNSLPSHQNNSELVKSSVKDRPIIPTHWSINTDKKKLPMESKTVKQKDSNETYASFNLDVLSKIYLNSEKVAQLNTNENNTFDNTTNTEITLTAGVPTDSLHYNGYYYSQSDFPKKVIHTKEFNASKKHDKAIRSESLDSHSPVEQIRYWRSVAAAAQANAAGQLARVDKLTQEVTRLRWDLSISHMENNLLRQNLASVQAELDQIHQISNSTVKRDKTMRHTLSP